MERNSLMLATALPALIGCSADLRNPEAREVAAQRSALFLDCSSELEEYIRFYQSIAGDVLTAAYENYNHDSPAALKYFGTQHMSDHMLGILLDTRGLAYSDSITWACEPEDPSSTTNCANPATVFYTKDNASSTHDYTIHVCGERIMQREGHRDDSNDASPTGALVHEISHLAGTWCDGSYGDGPVLERASANFATTFYAENYRYYVMHWDQD